ncbi:hypothetical protein R5R35_010117 [Gryllus longicercus]|uniref:tRNA-dihydrouridine(47) synthase [NAD(P)(+)] n=1 Tax=Gryllus longicercus TaxID=2509291 RepID=A0AAN9VMN9_9ORTH
MESGNNSGFAAIKPEFIIANHERTLALECLSEDDKKRLADVDSSKDSNEPNKHQKLNNGQRRILKGQNKARPCPFTRTPETELCSSATDLLESDAIPECSNPKCRFMHSIEDYLKLKPANIGSTCYVYSIRGRCPWGVSCRFGSEHTTDSGRNIINEGVWEEHQRKPQSETINSLSRDIQFKLRKKKYDFDKSEKILLKYSKNKPADKKCDQKTEDKEEEKEIKGLENLEVKNSEETSDEKNVSVKISCSTSNSDDKDIVKNDKPSGCVTDEDVISIRKEEKKKIDWSGKLYLSPLTTVGNLPFRRICRDFGVDITCGEMALATSLLQGAFQEWALVKRHSSENLFGVQLCGNNPYVMTRCAQLLQEQAVVDFVDINLGCPIELIYQQGAGSGLLRRERILESVVRSMSEVLTVPLTVKLRTGVSNNKNIAHTLVPKFGEWGASLITLHGRSREQRYTRLADWPYIEECAKLAKPTPLFGNGDILSFEDYENAIKNHPSVAGAMIGRGALIKPWIFTEIKERRHWDISSSERFDLLKKYVNYGLEHWGSDTKGVENTRRFLLEWLSFLHRYIPVGILEHVPQHMNERPPFYKGRDEMETLMASSNCADWVKISEQLLGPVPEGFHFLPKHKANSWK